MLRELTSGLTRALSGDEGLYGGNGVFFPPNTEATVRINMPRVMATLALIVALAGAGYYVTH